MWHCQSTARRADGAQFAHTGARAYATANGLPKGAVHLNFPFRKPLEPIPVETDLHELADAHPAGAPFTHITLPERGLYPDMEQVFPLVEAVRRARRGVIYMGSRAGDDLLTAEISALAEHLQFAVMADPLSNVRFHTPNEWVFGGYDTFLQADKTIESPDVVLQIGGMPTSQPLDDWLNSDRIEFRALISGDGVWTDPNHRIDEFVIADPRAVLRHIGFHFNEEREAALQNRDSRWIDRLHAAEHAVWNAVEEAKNEAYFDGMVVADAIDLLPDNANVFIANSLPVRHLDQFARPNGKHLRVFCNRGASGIDGTISSALGIAAAQPDRPLVLITGDLAFYHDLNGLLAINRCGLKITIVLINNDGGGIFYRLPIRNLDPPFEGVTLHAGLDFSHAAAMYGLKFTRTPERARISCSGVCGCVGFRASQRH
ncbi:MAG: thiamine pyrophosphate-dependent enzyme [Anaerolineae bacterium]